MNLSGGTLTQLINDLQASIQLALGDQLVGIYLSGSLACGDFDPIRSDVDFVVVMVDELTEAEIQALRVVHQSLMDNYPGWAEKLEGVFMTQAMIRRYQAEQPQFLAFNTGGYFGLDGQGSDGIIQRWMLREHGIVLYGPAPKELVDPISGDELRQATRQTLRDWWLPQVEQPFRLERREYQAYAVLTMCRMAYTLEHGAIVSKPAAARWALAHWEARWHGLIQRALDWQPDDGIDDRLATIELIRATCVRFL